MPKILVGDIETDAIHMPHNIWMVGVLDWTTDEFTAYHGEDVAEGLLRLQEADLLIGHNFRGYDAKNIRRMTDGLVSLDNSKIMDTMELGRRLVKMPDHKLKSWGEIFDFPKGDFKDFSRFSPEMIPYCERDCRLTKKVFDFLNELNVQKSRQNLLEGLI